MRIQVLAVALRTMTEPGLRDTPVPVAVHGVTQLTEARIVINPAVWTCAYVSGSWKAALISATLSADNRGLTIKRPDRRVRRSGL